jgi:Ca2+-binding EF-hand superfamily protein
MKFIFHESELREMVKVFREFDVDASDSLDEAEFNSYLQSIGQKSIFARLAFALFDLDKDKCLSFAEFALFLKGMELFNEDPLEFHRFVFKSVDVDDNGQLDANELSLYCNMLGMEESIEECSILIMRLTKGKSHSLTFTQLHEGIIRPLTEKTQ